MADESTKAAGLNETLRLLREEVSSLVKTVPGPMASVSLRAGETALEIRWDNQVPALPVPHAAGPGTTAPDAELSTVDDGIVEIAAALVGTFYVAASPGAPPFVEVGDRVEQGQTVGIVEAMKLMNPVAADCAGEVVEILARDAEPVEFGQVLVRIRVEES